MKTSFKTQYASELPSLPFSWYSWLAFFVVMLLIDADRYTPSRNSLVQSATSILHGIPTQEPNGRGSETKASPQFSYIYALRCPNHWTISRTKRLNRVYHNSRRLQVLFCIDEEANGSVAPLLLRKNLRDWVNITSLSLHTAQGSKPLSNYLISRCSLFCLAGNGTWSSR